MFFLKKVRIFLLCAGTWLVKRSMKLNCSLHQEFSATHRARTSMKKTLTEKNPSLVRGWTSCHPLPLAADEAAGSVRWGELFTLGYSCQPLEYFSVPCSSLCTLGVLLSSYLPRDTPDNPWDTCDYVGVVLCTRGVLLMT